MQRHRQDQLGLAVAEKLVAAPCHQPPERFSERHLAAVFEFLHNLAQRMFRQFFSWLTSPGARRGKAWRTLKTDAADMIVAAGIGKWPAANFAQRMRNQLNMLPAVRTKVFGIPAKNAARAGAATRRVKPIDEPI